MEVHILEYFLILLIPHFPNTSHLIDFFFQREKNRCTAQTGYGVDKAAKEEKKKIISVNEINARK